MNEKFKAIRGSKKRAGEVIKWLVEHGASNAAKQVDGNHEELLYFVNPEGIACSIEIEFECLVIVEELPRWRAESNKTYLYIDDEMGIYEDSDCRGSVSNNRYENGNYFRTREEAEEMRDKIIKLLKSRSNE